jgi:hypothetical protein
MSSTRKAPEHLSSERAYNLHTSDAAAAAEAAEAAQFDAAAAAEAVQLFEPAEAAAAAAEAAAESAGAGRPWDGSGSARRPPGILLSAVLST